MKEINCDIIKDLLPSYIDKTSSKSTNKLVKDHLQKCKDCSLTFSYMNKDIDSELLFNQNEHIDFLKGYKKAKTIAGLKDLVK